MLDKNIIPSCTELNKKNDVLEPNNSFAILSSGDKLKLRSVKIIWEITKQDLSISVDAMDFVHAVLEDFGSEKVEYTLKKHT